MGKGARNRQKRQELAVASRARRSLETLTLELFRIGSPRAFRRLVQTWPEVLSREMLEHCARLAGDEGFGELFASIGQLLREAQADPSAAWTTYEVRRNAAAEQGRQAAALMGEIEHRMAANEFDSVVRLADEAIPLARAAGLGLMVGELENHRGQALFQSAAPGRTDRIERAIISLNRAVILSADADRRAAALMHLGLAMGERVQGDRAENLDAAVKSLTTALDSLSESSPPWLWAIVRTNLAWALLRRERGDRVADLRRAESLCEQALEYRSPQLDAHDWAHTQLNLGEVRAKLFELGQTSLEQVERTYEAVIETEAVLEPRLIGSAHFMIGRFQRRAAHRTPQQFVDLHRAGHTDSELVETTLVESAYAHLSNAVDFSRFDHDPIRRGHTLSEASAAAQDLGLDGEAIPLAEEAFSLLTPTSDIPGCAAVAMRLGSMLSSRGAFSRAADTFRVAIEATDLSFFSRLDNESRDQEIRGAGNVHRWAAFAFAKTGHADEAVLVLETGRARELRRRVGSARLTTELSTLPAELRQEYEDRAASFVSAPLGPASAEAARQLQEIVATIRTVPGMEAFASAARASDVLEATEDEWPLVYVNPTPFGTVVLAVRSDAGNLIAEPIFLAPTSTEIFYLLSLGAAAPGHESPDATPGSYIMGIGAAGDAEVEDQLDLLLPWLGTQLALPICELLRPWHVSGVTLVLCGPLATAPIHAAVWRENGEPQCLLDHFDIRYAPSATIAGTSLSRVRARNSPSRAHLVALADPLVDLPGAQPEADYIAQLYPELSATAHGSNATSDFLFANAPSATHLHIAGHAYGGLFAEDDTALMLANGPLSLLDLSELQLQARVCVVSACQTALASLTGLPEEALSLATTMIVAGSACVIASLWPVEDGPTALLMIRLHDEVLSGSLSPPEALRSAQLWLRTLTFDDAQRALDEHPRLRDAFDYPESPLSTEPSDRPSHSTESPFAHPFLWAGFIAVGA